jgi:hypothetical protein
MVRDLPLLSLAAALDTSGLISKNGLLVLGDATPLKLFGGRNEKILALGKLVRF